MRSTLMCLVLASVAASCQNPFDLPSSSPALRCPSGTFPCGNGCISDQSAVCCDNGSGKTSSYCTNAGGGCYPNTNKACAAAFPATATAQFCCGSTGSFGSNDCPSGQHHCGLLCYPLSHACCASGASDADCPTTAWDPTGCSSAGEVGCGVCVATAQCLSCPSGSCCHGDPCSAVSCVSGPACIGIAGGGGGGGGGKYDGTWRGIFHYMVSVSSSSGPPQMVAASLTLTVTLVTKVSGALTGTEVLTVTNASCTDATFGAVTPVTPDATLSLALLPSTFGTTAPSGDGISVMFPNGSTIATTNGAGALSVSSDGKTLSSTSAVSTMAFTASSGTVADSNMPGSGPGGYAYNSCTFTDWTLVKQ